MENKRKAQRTARTKQINESKDMLSQALLALLQEHSLADLGISQVCNKAHISRNTFYRYFGSMEAILQYTMDKLMRELLQQLSLVDNPSIRDILIWRFRTMQERPLLKVLVQNPQLEEMWRNFLLSNASNTILAILQDRLPAGDSLLGYTLDYTIGGVVSVTQAWIKKGMVEKPEEMAELVSQLLPVQLREQAVSQVG